MCLFPCLLPILLHSPPRHKATGSAEISAWSFRWWGELKSCGGEGNRLEVKGSPALSSYFRENPSKYTRLAARKQGEGEPRARAEEWGDLVTSPKANPEKSPTTVCSRALWLALFNSAPPPCGCGFPFHQKRDRRRQLSGGNPKESIESSFSLLRGLHHTRLCLKLLWSYRGLLPLLLLAENPTHLQPRDSPPILHRSHTHSLLLLGSIRSNGKSYWLVPRLADCSASRLDMAFEPYFGLCRSRNHLQIVPLAAGAAPRTAAAAAAASSARIIHALEDRTRRRGGTEVTCGEKRCGAACSWRGGGGCWGPNRLRFCSRWGEWCQPGTTETDGIEGSVWRALRGSEQP